MATVRKQERAALSDIASTSSLPVILIIAAMVIGLTALLPLVQSSGATSTAGQIQQMEQEKQDWQARLRELEVDVATLGSLTRVEKEARLRLGMTKPTTVHYIAVDAPPPEERKLPSRFLPPSQNEHAAGSSLWDDLFGWLP
jgi:cell division protein FtsL